MQAEGLQLTCEHIVPLAQIKFGMIYHQLKLVAI